MYDRSAALLCLRLDVIARPFVNRRPFLPATGRQSLLSRPQNYLTCGWAAPPWPFPAKTFPKLAATSVENVVKALQSHRWTATARIFDILFSQWVNRANRQKKSKEFGRLTLLLALAELLAEILGHHAWARAVAGMVRVVTWLVVVHLIGRVIWSSRGRRLRQCQDRIVALLFFFFLRGNLPFLSWIFAHNLVK